MTRDTGTWGEGTLCLRLDMGHLMRDTRTLLMEDEGFKYQLLMEESYQS